MITDGVTPSLHIDYKLSKIKQYHKEGRALHTETTINDTRDFAIGKRLINLPALREVGFTANRRLLRAQHFSHDPILGDDTFTAITAPVTTGSQRVPGLRFDQPRTQALLSILTIFRLLPAGFTNADLRAHLKPLLNQPNLSAGDATTTYYTNDLARTVAQGSATTTYTVDVLTNRFRSYSTTTSGTTVNHTNHYSDDSGGLTWRPALACRWARFVPGAR